MLVTLKIHKIYVCNNDMISIAFIVHLPFFFCLTSTTRCFDVMVLPPLLYLLLEMCCSCGLLGSNNACYVWWHGVDKILYLMKRKNQHLCMHGGHVHRKKKKRSVLLVCLGKILEAGIGTHYFSVPKGVFLFAVLTCALWICDLVPFSLWHVRLQKKLQIWCLQMTTSVQLSQLLVKEGLFTTTWRLL